MCVCVAQRGQLGRVFDDSVRCMCVCVAQRGQLGRVLDDTASRQSTSAWLPAPVNGIGQFSLTVTQLALFVVYVNCEGRGADELTDCGDE